MDVKVDNRTPCKYGSDCYQKNSEHLKKYKHPRKSDSDNENRVSPKRLKEETNSSCVEENIILKEDKIIATELPAEVKERIEVLFQLEMPDDFYDFFEFCKSISSNSPKTALKSINLELVGPFDVFDGALKDCTKEEVFRHYRYYFDPPELQTVLKGNDDDQLHYGYFRDNPKSLPCFVAKNKAVDGPTITCVAGNLFAVVKVHADEVLSSADVFRKTKIQKLLTALVKWARKNKFSLDTVTSEIKSRRSKIVAKTFNGIGVVVPFDRKTDIGYRPLAVDNKALESLLKGICSASSSSEQDIAWSKLQPTITAASIANDECDFGTSLELGMNLFAFGEKVLHATIEQVLCTTYKLLKRDLFADILQAHLKLRIKGTDLSTIL